MSESFDRILTGMLGVAAGVMAVVLVHREFFSPAVQSTDRRQSSYMADWKELARSGHSTGDEGARVQLVEFADLECPFCAHFNESIRAIRQKYPTDVSYTFIHFPISGHRFAKPAARAAECAGQQDRFFEMIDAVYSRQDSLGINPWTAFAHSAGVSDSGKFLRCLASAETPSTIDSGVALAHKLGVNATPTVVLNGWRYGYTPTDTELTHAIDALLAGKKPYPEMK